MNSNNKIWGTLLKVFLGLILVLSFFQVKMKFGWDPVKEYLCDDSCGIKPPSIDVESIALPDSMEINVNKTQQILAQIKPTNATNQNLKWSSSDTTVAIVDPTTGRVTATGKGGECIITAAATDKSGTTANIKIKVNNPDILVDTIIFPNSNGEITLNPGSEFIIDAKSLPENATNKTLTWKSDDEGVATVDNGVVTGKEVGYCTITAYSTDGGDVHRSTIVRVQKPDTIVKVTSIVLDKSNISMGIGERYKIRATVSPSNATNKTLQWKSTKENVAIVENGVITGKRAGTCTIIVSSTDGGNAFPKKIDIHVKASPINIDNNSGGNTEDVSISIEGNTLEEKVNYCLSFFTKSQHTLQEKKAVAKSLKKLLALDANIYVLKGNNISERKEITRIDTWSSNSEFKNITLISIGGVDSNGKITELNVKEFIK